MAAEVLHEVGPGLREIFAFGNVAILAAILYITGRKGIKASIEERSTTIAKRLEETRKGLTQIRAEVFKSQQQLKDIESAKKKIFDQVEEEGRRLSAQLLAEAEQNANRILADARATAENEFRLASGRLKEKLVKEALAQSEEMVRSEKAEPGNLQERLHERLFDKFIDELQKES